MIKLAVTGVRDESLLEASQFKMAATANQTYPTQECTVYNPIFTDNELKFGVVAAEIYLLFIFWVQITQVFCLKSSCFSSILFLQDIIRQLKNNFAYFSSSFLWESKVNLYILQLFIDPYNEEEIPSFPPLH